MMLKNFRLSRPHEGLNRHFAQGYNGRPKEETTMATMQPMSRIISISDLPWEQRQAGSKRKLLWEDPATQRRALMFRIEPSAQFACHRHIGDELIFVIEGAISDGVISDEFGTVTAGNMGYRPDGCVHALSTKHGATLLAILTG